MKKPAWLVLCIITVVAGLALSATNLLTEGPIAEQQLLASNAARIAVFTDADAFEEMPVETDSKMDSVYAAKQKGETVGYVLQTTVTGYGGPIEIVMGIDNNGKITGISVGGSNFAETAGLGARTRTPEFTDQFIGLSEAPILKQNVDAISGATISSTAVTSGANRCYLYWQQLVGLPQSAAQPDAETAATSGATEKSDGTGAATAETTAAPAADATTGATVEGDGTGAATPEATAAPAADATTGATVEGDGTGAATPAQTTAAQ